MKNLKFALLLILGVALFMPACKKGEGDPFFSFKSRNKRISGKWKLVKVEGKETTTQETYTPPNTVITSVVINYNGAVESRVTTTTQTGFDPVVSTYTPSYTYFITLDERGFVDYDFLFTDTTGFSSSHIGDGTWVWGSNTKSKDYVTISLNATGTLASLIPSTGCLYIYELKSKEMILKQTVTALEQTPLSKTDIKNEYTFTFEKQ